MFLLEDARIVEQSSEISTGNVFLTISRGSSLRHPAHHSEENVVFILESVQQSNQPRCLDRAQDISLDQNMLDFIHLCQSTLPHLFQRTDFVGIYLSSEVDGSISTLSDLSDDSELLESKLSSSFTKEYPFTAIVRLDLFGICFASHLRSA